MRRKQFAHGNDFEFLGGDGKLDLVTRGPGRPGPAALRQQEGFQALEAVEREAGVGHDANDSWAEPAVEADHSLRLGDHCRSVHNPAVLHLPVHLEGEPGPDGIEGEGGGDGDHAGQGASHKLHFVGVRPEQVEVKLRQQLLEYFERCEL